MKAIIERIVATEVVVHAREGYVDRPAFGASIFDKASKWLLEVFTSDGLVGYGESARGVSRTDVEHSARAVLGRPLLDFPWRAQATPDFSDDDMFGHETPPVPHRFYEQSFGSSAGMQAVRVALDDLIKETLVVGDGAIQVPAGVGLGVTPDRQAVEKHTCSQMVLDG